MGCECGSDTGWPQGLEFCGNSQYERGYFTWNLGGAATRTVGHIDLVGGQIVAKFALINEVISE
jgi:hypothetical protein